MEWLLAILMWLFPSPEQESFEAKITPSSPRMQSRTMQVKDDGKDPRLKHRFLQHHIIVVEDTEFKPPKNSDRD